MKPLLAGKVEDISKLRYPLVASPKLDGIRCLIVDGKPVSRKLKTIPNMYICGYLGGANLPALDGELMLPGKAFNEISSAVMSEDGYPKDFEYRVFDKWDTPDVPYAQRLIEVAQSIKASTRVYMVDYSVIKNAVELTDYEEKCLSAGHEGVMVRSIDGRYKYGRSTANEGILLKLKRFEDSEATIIGATEEYRNGNAATVDELGHTKRSSHKANLQGKGCLGAFRVRRADGLEFDIGTGFTAEQRLLYWKGIDLLVGKIVVYKHQPHGALDKPRFPVFKGFRHKDDI